MKEETKIEILKVAVELTRFAIDEQNRAGNAGKKKDVSEIFLNFVTVVKEHITKIP